MYALAHPTPNSIWSSRWISQLDLKKPRETPRTSKHDCSSHKEKGQVFILHKIKKKKTLKSGTTIGAPSLCIQRLKYLQLNGFISFEIQETI